MPIRPSKNKAGARAFTEAPVWHSLGKGWQPLWPGFRENGFSLEWHDFDAPAALDYTGSFHPDSIEICLNASGCAELSLAGTTRPLAAGHAVFYVNGRQRIAAKRLPGQRHQFLTIEISRDFLRDRLSTAPAGLRPEVAQLLSAGKPSSRITEPARLGTDHQQLIPVLRHSPAPSAGRAMWFESKVLELMSAFFFVPEKELFCERQRRVTQERVQRVVELLRQNLAEPPDLLELGRRAGCSPFYLSRTFSQEMGVTIPQYLRQLRMERAAELLRSGKFNVTEAAMEVGYSSLSHFSQAFCQAMGCCPNLYPLLNR